MTAIEIPNVVIRKARVEDSEAFLGLIDALAAYEKLEPPDEQARQRLLRDGFGSSPRFEAYLAEIGGVVAGYSIVFETYSSFLALPTLYLEDIFVLPEHRKRKIGLALFLAMGGLAKERGCGRMEWSVLDWNEPAHDFYKRLGAKRMKEWCPYRLSREELWSLPGICPAGAE
jgi:GNAT superfamily N-acetyltransferase